MSYCFHRFRNFLQSLYYSINFQTFQNYFVAAFIIDDSFSLKNLRCILMSGWCDNLF